MSSPSSLRISGNCSSCWLVRPRLPYAMHRMRENPAPLPCLQQALAIAKFDPGMYEVIDTYSGTALEP